MRASRDRRMGQDRGHLTATTSAPPLSRLPPERTSRTPVFRDTWTSFQSGNERLHGRPGNLVEPCRCHQRAPRNRQDVIARAPCLGGWHGLDRSPARMLPVLDPVDPFVQGVHLCLRSIDRMQHFYEQGFLAQECVPRLRQMHS